MINIENGELKGINNLLIKIHGWIFIIMEREDAVKFLKRFQTENPLELQFYFHSLFF